MRQKMLLAVGRWRSLLAFSEVSYAAVDCKALREEKTLRLGASSKLPFTNTGQPTTVFWIARATTCIYLWYSHLGSKVQFRISMGRMEKSGRIGKNPRPPWDWRMLQPDL